MEYNFPVGLVNCSSNPIYSYNFECIGMLSKPWGDPRGKLYDANENIIKIYTTWFKLLAKAFNSHAIDEEIIYSIPLKSKPPQNLVLF